MRAQVSRLRLGLVFSLLKRFNFAHYFGDEVECQLLVGRVFLCRCFVAHFDTEQSDFRLGSLLSDTLAIYHEQEEGVLVLNNSQQLGGIV